LPASIALTVCLVTPTRSASSPWVISLAWKRRARIEFVTRVGLTTSATSSVENQLGNFIAELTEHQREQ
jgi:hypothetical protein